MKVSQENKRFVRKTIEYYRNQLFLQQWTIDIKYMAADENTERGDILAADITVSLNYTRATVRIYPHFWMISRDEQKEVLLHELCHILVEPYSMVYEKMINGRLVSVLEEKDLNEVTTQAITRIVHAYENQ